MDPYALLQNSLSLALAGGVGYFIKGWIDWIVHWACSLIFCTLKPSHATLLWLTKQRDWNRIKKRDEQKELLPGDYLFWHTRPVLIHVSKPEKGSSDLELSTLWCWKSVLDEIAAAASNDSGHGKTINLWSYKLSDNHWAWLGNLEKLPLKLLALPQGLAQDLLDDAQRFVADEQLYVQRGIPWRRGYLFYGPPGTGKSSLAKAIASELGLGLVLCTATKFKDLMASMSALRFHNHAVVLLDDVEHLLEKENFDMGELLSAIDNLYGKRVIVVLTCNDPSKLPPKLLRAGRIDKKFKLDYADDYQIGCLFDKFFPRLPHMAQRFLKQCKTSEQLLTPATLQNYLIGCANADQALQVRSHLDLLLLEQKELAINYSK